MVLLFHSLPKENKVLPTNSLNKTKTETHNLWVSFFVSYDIIFIREYKMGHKIDLVIAYVKNKDTIWRNNLLKSLYDKIIK